MLRSNEMLFGWILAISLAGCSAITTWPEVNDKTQLGGAGGKDPGNSSSSPGGASQRGGASSRGGTAASNSAGAAGIQDLGGASSSIGGLAYAGAGNSGIAGQSGNAQHATAGAAGLPTLVGSTAGSTAQAGNAASGAAGMAYVAGGTAGSGAATLVITMPTVPSGKTGVPYATSVTATGASQYTWSIGSGSLPGGITLQNTTSASVSIAGTPTEAGLFPVQLNVTDGTATQSVDVQLAVTHKVAFLSDRTTPGVQELYMVEVGGEKVADPVRINKPLEKTGISNFAWSPDASRIAYRTNSDLWIANVARPGEATNLGVQLSAYAWLGGGNALALALADGRVQVVDVSGTAPWSPIGVPVAAVAAGRAVSSSTITISPHASDFGLSRVIHDTPVSGNPSWEQYHIVWSRGSAPIAASLGIPDADARVDSYSFDGAMLATYMAGFYAVFDLAVPTSPMKRFPDLGQRPTWSPNTASILTPDQMTDPTDVWGVKYRKYSAGIWTTIEFATPSSCAPSPGPWSPNGNHALFTCGADLRAIGSVNSALAGSDQSLLPDDFATNSFTSINGYGWSPDSNWIALRADRFADTVDDLFIARFSTPRAATRPYGSAKTPGVNVWRFSPNSRYIAYVGILGDATIPGLHISQLPNTGFPTNSTQLTEPTSSAVQGDIEWLAGSRTLVYRANDNGGPQLHAIHVSDVGTSGSPMSISGTSGTGVSTYRIAPLVN